MSDVVVMVGYGGQWTSTKDNTMTYAGGKQKMVIIQPEMTYQELVELLSSRLCIDRGCNCIQITMKSEYSINGMPYKIEDDDDIACVIALSKKMTQMVSLYLTATPKTRRASPTFVSKASTTRPSNNFQEEHYCGPHVTMKTVNDVPQLVDKSKQPIHDSTLNLQTSNIRDGVTRGERVFRVMEIFQDKDVMQDAFRRHALETGFQYKVIRSTKCRWEVKCLYEQCQWRVRATKLEGCECFQLQRLDNGHNCPRDQRMSHHRMDCIYKPKKIITDMAKRYKIDIFYAQAWQAKNWALNDLRSSLEESFMLLPKYCYNLELHNPGTVTHIETDGANRFKFFFMALGCCVRVFRDHIRPVICVDAAFLKSKYLETLYIAVGKDGNNQVYPLAFGVGGKEEIESWTFFMSKIRDCIGSVNKLSIISDRHPAIITAVANVFPKANHGCCCIHLKAHIRSEYKKTKAIEGLYWKAAKTYCQSDFQDIMRIIFNVNPDAAMYLTNIGFHRWARAHFPRHRYNIMASNIMGSFNAFVKGVCGLPITLLAELIRQNIQKWFYTRRSVAGKN